MSKLPWQVREDEANIKKFETDAAVDSQGVVRWKSNNQVPFPDMLQLWAESGKSFNLSASVAARKVDDSAFLQAYRSAQANRTPEQIAEERLMALGAHGAGVTLVNVLTGDKFTT